MFKGNSFVTLYTDFSFKNALAKNYSLLCKGKCFIDKRAKGFSLKAIAFYINCLKEKSLYKNKNGKNPFLDDRE